MGELTVIIVQLKHHYFLGLQTFAEKNSLFIRAINSTEIPLGQSYSHA